ncbi:hypothetical protein Sango_2083400 [Sesamum angolense]|uniref:Uncharacterized protein n=1 Tax=Sesamum angolense TaxID=2727404 RepID=A0AAE2BLW2_9LAMI|nr:hypothetical protein Sango_2083400 [Sesamum angolense]
MELLLIEFLGKNVDIFAWSASDFQGIGLEVTEYQLNVDLTVKPVWRKRRNFGPENNLIIENKVNKLLSINNFPQVQYTEWLANVVILPKLGKMENVH